MILCSELPYSHQSQRDDTGAEDEGRENQNPCWFDDGGTKRERQPQGRGDVMRRPSQTSARLLDLGHQASGTNLPVNIQRVLRDALALNSVIGAPEKPDMAMCGSPWKSWGNHTDCHPKVDFLQS